MSKYTKILSLFFTFALIWPVNGSAVKCLDFLNNGEFDRGLPFKQRFEIFNALRQLHDESQVGKHQKFTSDIISTSDGYPIHRFKIGNENSKKRILITSGVHAGTEPHAVKVGLELIRQMMARANSGEDFYLEIYPLLNPWGFFNGKRRNSEEIDFNRVMLDEPDVEAMKNFALAISTVRFALALDLHGGLYRDGFFVIRAGDDGGLAKRAVSALPNKYLQPSDSGLYPDYTGVKIDPKRYLLSSRGVATSTTPGTVKQYLTSHADNSYTLEYPGQRSASDIQRLYLKLINSFIDYIQVPQ